MRMHRVHLTPIEKAGMKAHGLQRAIGKPSRLADVFRQGVAWGLRANELTDEQIDATTYAQCPDFNEWHEGPSLDDVRAIVRRALGSNG